MADEPVPALGLILVLDIILNLKDGDNGSYAVGLAAGMYSGLTYGLKEARGTHDWVSCQSSSITFVTMSWTSVPATSELNLKGFYGIFSLLCFNNLIHLSDLTSTTRNYFGWKRT